jgi:hypothetical protein
VSAGPGRGASPVLDLVSGLAGFLAAEGAALDGTLAAAAELCRSLRSSSNDPRLQRLGALLAEAVARRADGEAHARVALLEPLAATAEDGEMRRG